MRKLRAREFHQIAGRAGRMGFDTEGLVIAEAPEFEIENAKALAKAGNDPKKLKKIKRKKAPEGFVTWNENTFDKLIDAAPETLVPHMKISTIRRRLRSRRSACTPARTRSSRPCSTRTSSRPKTVTMAARIIS